ncbi:uncharacterized protein F4822DRAFT_431813 [Hypoxylon trugodes]|uniref:uncharacterized protein n=1 Tax=Hypoxylon trugodes TaxID=326681 RepID=UPI002196ACE8|nr:uncharacterized protein F4822DRAFT_431813 [Hypoxylon trugodes]KAI1386947.1 hypothetical protein F4822DRAFT_431813 [Hypoxylon trugodes]
MARLLSLLSLAATLLTTTLALPSLTPIPRQDPADMDEPTVIFNKLIDASASINVTVIGLMNSRADQDDSQRLANAASGLNDLQDEQALVSQMLNGLVFAGDHSQDGNFQTISEADKKVVGFFHTAMRAPQLQVAQDCGVAIACERNTILNILTIYANKYNKVVNCNNDNATSFFPTGITAPGLNCGSMLQFCPL